MTDITHFKRCPKLQIRSSMMAKEKKNVRRKRKRRKKGHTVSAPTQNLDNDEESEEEEDSDSNKEGGVDLVDHEDIEEDDNNKQNNRMICLKTHERRLANRHGIEYKTYINVDDRDREDMEKFYESNSGKIKELTERFEKRHMTINDLYNEKEYIEKDRNKEKVKEEQVDTAAYSSGSSFYSCTSSSSEITEGFVKDSDEGEPGRERNKSREEDDQEQRVVKRCKQRNQWEWGFAGMGMTKEDEINDGMTLIEQLKIYKNNQFAVEVGKYDDDEVEMNTLETEGTESITEKKELQNLDTKNRSRENEQKYVIKIGRPKKGQRQKLDDRKYINNGKQQEIEARDGVVANTNYFKQEKRQYGIGNYLWDEVDIIRDAKKKAEVKKEEIVEKCINVTSKAADRHDVRSPNSSNLFRRSVYRSSIQGESDQTTTTYSTKVHRSVIKEKMVRHKPLYREYKDRSPVKSPVSPKLTRESEHTTSFQDNSHKTAATLSTKVHRPDVKETLNTYTPLYRECKDRSPVRSPANSKMTRGSKNTSSFQDNSDQTVTTLFKKDNRFDVTENLNRHTPLNGECKDFTPVRSPCGSRLTRGFGNNPILQGDSDKTAIILSNKVHRSDIKEKMNMHESLYGEYKDRSPVRSPVCSKLTRGSENTPSFQDNTNLTAATLSSKANRSNINEKLNGNAPLYEEYKDCSYRSPDDYKLTRGTENSPSLQDNSDFISAPLPTKNSRSGVKENLNGHTPLYGKCKDLTSIRSPGSSRLPLGCRNRSSFQGDRDKTAIMLSKNVYRSYVKEKMKKHKSLHGEYNDLAPVRSSDSSKLFCGSGNPHSIQGDSDQTATLQSGITPSFQRDSCRTTTTMSTKVHHSDVKESMEGQTSLYRDYKYLTQGKVPKHSPRSHMVTEWIENQRKAKCSAPIVGVGDMLSEIKPSLMPPGQFKKHNTPRTSRTDGVLACDLDKLETILFMRGLVNDLCDKAGFHAGVMNGDDDLYNLPPDEELDGGGSEVKADNKQTASPVMHHEAYDFITMELSLDRDDCISSPSCRLGDTQRNSMMEEVSMPIKTGHIEESSSGCYTLYTHIEEDMEQYDDCCSSSLIGQRSRIPVPARGQASPNFESLQYIVSNTRLTQNGKPVSMRINQKLDLTSKYGSKSSITLGGQSSKEAEQFKGTQLFRQRLKMAKQGIAAWENGLSPLQIWLVMHHVTVGLDESRPQRKMTRPSDAKAKISCWR